MKFNKKNLITLGALASVTAPLVAVISCGSDSEEQKEPEQQAPTDTGTDQTPTDQTPTDQTGTDQTPTDQQGTEQQGAQTGTDQTRVDNGGSTSGGSSSGGDQNTPLNPPSNTPVVNKIVIINQTQINDMFTTSHVENGHANFTFKPATIQGITFELASGAKTDGLADGTTISVIATPDATHKITSTIGTAGSDGSYTFTYTVSVEKINIDFYAKYGLDYKTITEIPYGTFQNVTLPDGFTLPQNITTIKGFAFSGTELPDSFTIPQGVTNIELQAFSSAKLPEGFTLPPSAINLENCAFLNVVIPSSFKIPAGAAIGYLTFGETHLPAGFKIPSDATFSENLGGEFDKAKLPVGYHWSLPGGAVPGSEVVAITP